MRSRRRASALLAGFFALALLALVWPGPLLAGTRIRPFVLGLPFSLAWSVAWILAIFLALALYHRAVDGGRE